MGPGTWMGPRGKGKLSRNCREENLGGSERVCKPACANFFLPPTSGAEAREFWPVFEAPGVCLLQGEQ